MRTVTPTAPRWTTLFNRPAFHALNLAPGEQAFAVEHHEDGHLVGSLAGVLAGGVLTSGASAPFGGPDFARARETPARIASMLDATLRSAKTAGAEQIRIRLRPAPYSCNEAVVLYELLNRGFRVEIAELAHVIDLAGTPTAAAYVAALRPPARRALRHLEGESWAFAEAIDERAWRDAHALLEENRGSKGRRLSLAADYVLAARAALPGGLRMFTLAHDGVVCAAALVYVAAPGCWYVYAWGDARHDLARSPMNLLALRVVEAALAEDVRVVDLGHSSVPPPPGGRLVIDPGLAQFKTSVLARPHPRLVLVR